MTANALKEDRAMALSAVARSLEVAARDGRLEGAGDQIEQAEAELARARVVLEVQRHEL